MLVWVALMLSVLLGIGALVIDAGALYAERRQLQNGADAAALAVAMDCAKGNCDLAAGQAGDYANKNANDGAANVDSVCGVGPGLPACATPPAAAAGKSAWVQVATSTRKPDNSTKVDFVLAPVLDATNVGSTVHASAVATWGPVAGAITLPLAYGICELERLGMTLDPLFIPTTPGIIYLPGTEPKNVQPPPCADTAPGGFLWLDDNFGPNDCNVKITVGDPMSSDPGKSEPPACATRAATRPRGRDPGLRRGPRQRHQCGLPHRRICRFQADGLRPRPFRQTRPRELRMQEQYALPQRCLQTSRH